MRPSETSRTSQCGPTPARPSKSPLSRSSRKKATRSRLAGRALRPRRSCARPTGTPAPKACTADPWRPRRGGRSSRTSISWHRRHHRAPYVHGRIVVPRRRARRAPRATEHPRCRHRLAAEADDERLAVLRRRLPELGKLRPSDQQLAHSAQHGSLSVRTDRVRRPSGVGKHQRWRVARQCSRRRALAAPLTRLSILVRAPSIGTVRREQLFEGFAHLWRLHLDAPLGYVGDLLGGVRASAP